MLLPDGRSSGDGLAAPSAAPSCEVKPVLIGACPGPWRHILGPSWLCSSVLVRGRGAVERPGGFAAEIRVSRARPEALVALRRIHIDLGHHAAGPRRHDDDAGREIHAL